MRLRKRIKNAVFAFFKEEILKCYEPPFEPIPAITDRRELQFKEVKAEFKIQEENFDERHFNYEASLLNCKRALFDELQEYIVVDPRSVIDEVYRERRIRLSIFVGMKPD